MRIAFALLLVFCLWLQPAPALCFFLGGVSLKDEKAMGRKFDVMVRSHMPMIEDPEVKAYVNGLVNRLTRAMPPQPFEFSTSVALHPALNAFAVPGGYVCVFSGLIMNLDNEAELAGVLSHELAHVTQRHVAARLERAQYLSLGALLAGVAGIAIGGPAGAAAAITAAGASQSAMLSYSRLDESEADHIGLQYLSAAGYPASGMTGGFKVLRKKSWLSGISAPTYLSTHPAIGDRINSLDAKIAAMPANRKNATLDNRRFQRVKTLLWARYGDAQAALQRFSGKDALSLMGRGIVLSRLNRLPEAQASFAAAMQKSPNDPLVLRESGIFHYRKGDSAKAEALLTQAMRLDPKDYMASFFYARLLDETGRARQADPHYREVLRHVPQDPEVHQAFARSLGRSGDQYRAYVHLTYASLYANDRRQAQRHLEQARKLAESSNDKRPFQKLEAAFKERKEIWDKS
ncbi:MAG: M48 family metalloprotease [Desulfovibrio sp.]|nr:M48 family metalloprotease [Desulfovibrio sp.]